jgi:signal recognition particle receptor subunit beta
MSFINEKTKEISCKVVYYGPSQSGKSTTLKHIYDEAKQKAKGDLISLNQASDRTLYFDFVPLNLGKIKGYTIRLHLYTVPGEIAYKQARALTSKGLDGVVFVADSQLDKVEENIASLNSLQEILIEEGHDFTKMPLVIQYNKQDLPGAIPAKELSEFLNQVRAEEFETIATSGKGVFEALKAISSKVLLDLQRDSVA